MSLVSERDGTRTGRAVAPSIALGVGFGAFFDGIVLHQVLQWHHMLSAHTPPTTLATLELNTVQDDAVEERAGSDAEGDGRRDRTPGPSAIPFRDE